MEETTFADIDFFFMFLVLFSKQIKFSMKKTTLQKNVIVEEELDGIGRNGIGNLDDLLKLMLINQDCWNPHVVVDGGEVARYINQQKKPDVLPVCSCPICDNAIDKSISSIASGIL